MKFDTPATTNPIDQFKVVGQPVDRIDGRAERDAVGEVERQRHRGKLTLVVDRQRCGGDLDGADAAQRDRTVLSAHVDVVERVGLERELGPDLEHHAILVTLGVERGDLTLPERAV